MYLEDSDKSNTGLKKAQQNRDVCIKCHQTLVNTESVDHVLMKVICIKSQLLHCVSIYTTINKYIYNIDVAFYTMYPIFEKAVLLMEIWSNMQMAVKQWNN